MGIRIQKHRMVRWVNKMPVVFFLLASWEAAAGNVLEYKAPLPDIYWSIDSYGAPPTRPGPYTSATEACGAVGCVGPFVVWKTNQAGNLGHGLCQQPNGYLCAQIHSYMKCPEPTVNSQGIGYPYSFNWNTAMCYRSVPALFNIALSSGSEVEPSNGSTPNTLPIIASVIDQNTNQPPATPVTVHISLKVEPNSGGHDHGDSTRPRGGIATVQTCGSNGTCWSNPTVNGAVVFNFNAPEASGTHTITATCDGCSNTATKTVDVKVSDLWPIPESVYYALTEDGSSRVIGDNGNHSGNHYLTSAASMSVWRLARGFYEYQVQNGVAIPTLLHLNDASLKWGGKFDVRGAWTGYHYTHDRGNVIDIRANTAAGYIPEEYFADFENMATEIEADAQLHCSETRDPALDNCAGDENRHYHVILN